MLRTISRIDDLKEVLQEAREAGKTIGFVPTMGALHEGHLALLGKAKGETGLVVCSIFVNPTQFDNAEDLAKYPVQPEEDARQLGKAGCDILFAPPVEEMNLDAQQGNYDLGGLDRVMEGLYRPGHFNGVACVVAKLFEIVMPDKAYFGEKDYQQLQIIRRLTDKLALPVEVIGVETVRDADGLAKSSRNSLLSDQERHIARAIPGILFAAMEKRHDFEPMELKQWVEDAFSKEPEIRLQYFELVDADSLQPVSAWEEAQHIVGCLAVYVDGVRLIDNMKFK